MTISRAFSWATVAWSMSALLSGCDYDCPAGSVRKDNTCIVSSSPKAEEAQPPEKNARSKDGGTERTEDRDAQTSEPHDEGGTGGTGKMSPRDADGGKAGTGPKPMREPDRPAADSGMPKQPEVAGQPAEAGHPAEAGSDGHDTAAAAHNFASKGGAVLKHPDIALLFWGSAWTASPSVTAGQVAGALQHMLAGPYFANLNQYGDLAYPSLTWVTVDTNTAVPGHAPSADEVTSYINARLEANAAPALGGEQLLIVVLPPGAVKDGALGERGQGKFNGTSYRYAWVASGQSINDGRSPTYSITRHILHSMSNPDGDGWVDANGGEELSAVCGWTTISGVAHPQYWSNLDGRCVVPREYGRLLRYDGSPNAWTPVWSRVRMAACGGYGLVATDANDNLFKYNGQPDNWVQIGLPGAQHVVGPDTVYGLTPDLSAIYRYTKQDTSWVKIGNQSINMFVGGFGVFATELGSNNIKKWSGEGSAWADFGGPGASFAVGADFIAGLSPDHSGVLRSTESVSWAPVKTDGTNQIFSSGNSNYLAATDRADLDAVFIFKEGTTWARQGFPGYTFALTTRDLFGLTPNRWGIFQSTDLSATSPSWTQISDSVHNLVPGCDTSLYGLSGLIQCDEGANGTTGSTCATTVGP